MSTPGSFAVRTFQGDTLSDVFREAADWLDQSLQPLDIESIHHAVRHHSSGAPQVLSIFFVSPVQEHPDELPAASRPTWDTVARAIFDELDIGYAQTGRQIGPRNIAAGEWILLGHAVQMVKAIVFGPHGALNAVKTPDVVPESVDIDQLHEAAVTWFGEIVDHLGGPQALADKGLMLRAVAPRVVLASLGSAFLDQDEHAMSRARAALTEIQWGVSLAWQGIGGHITEGAHGPTLVAGSGRGSIGRALQAMKPDTDIGRAVRERR